MDEVTDLIIEKAVRSRVRNAVKAIELEHGVRLSVHIQQNPQLTKDGFPTSLHRGVAISVLPTGVAEPHKVAERAQAAVDTLIKRVTTALKQIDI
jgi:hypothetical protein